MDLLVLFIERRGLYRFHSVPNQVLNSPLSEDANPFRYDCHPCLLTLPPTKGLNPNISTWCPISAKSIAAIIPANPAPTIPIYWEIPYFSSRVHSVHGAIRSSFKNESLRPM